MIWSSITLIGKAIAFLIAATILGGILGALADLTIPNAIAGTVLGAQNTNSPLAWTTIAATILAIGSTLYYGGEA